MQCPVCDERLREVEKHGVMVDICPGCKGVWLDRGELEKIARMEERDDFDGDLRKERDEHSRDRHDGDGYRGEYKHGTTKKRSLLSDLLEGFGD